MVAEPPFSLRRAELPWLIVSVLVLFPCLYYPYRAVVPHLGFSVSADWRVTESDPCMAGEDCLRLGDQLLSIGELSFEQYEQGRNTRPFRPFEEPGQVEVRVRREGIDQTLIIGAGRRPSGGQRFRALQVLFPMVMWLAGTTAVLLLRPRDERWLVLLLFHYVTAIWFAAGLASSRQVGGAAVVFHFVVWFFLPLAVHLHLILPQSLIRRRWALLAPLYLGSAALAVLDTAKLLGEASGLYALSFLAGVVLSISFLVARLFLPVSPAVRVANRIMLYGVALGFGPLIVFYLLPLIAPELAGGGPDREGFFPWALAIFLVAIPILPLSYIYAIYKHLLGALEFRANRLLGVYSFFSLYISLYVVVFFVVVQKWAAVDRRAVGATLAVSLAFVAAAPFLRGRFQALIDRHIFGIRHTPEEVVSLVASKIPSAFNRATLTKVMKEEILPTLLVRQSALCLFVDGDREVLYEQGLSGGEAAPTVGELGHLLRRSGRYLSAEASPPTQPWIRLALPLGLHAEAIGLWLFGRRDPDDHYPASDIKLLTTVANQVAAMLENILLYERAQDEIAQRRAADEENRQLQGQLLHSQKMEAIGRLSAGVAHDFNNCLLAIFGFSDFLLARPTDDPLVTRSLNGIREAGQKAANLTKQLLAFTRQQPMEPKVVSLNAVVSGVEPMVKGVLGGKVELVSRLASDLPEVLIDPVKIEQVILNLAVNAHDAMPRGGRLAVETRTVELAAGSSPHPDLQPGRYALLMVSDNGMGMDATTQARAFEPFYSTKKLGEGTGLGLSTAYGIVRQSGGHIGVESTPGQGATFSIYLPAAVATAEARG